MVMPLLMRSSQGDYKVKIEKLKIKEMSISDAITEMNQIIKQYGTYENYLRETKSK